MGHSIGSTHRPRVFQPAIWNQSVSATDGLARTNIATEGSHFGLQALFQESHPNNWTFLRQLKKTLLSINLLPFKNLQVPRTQSEKKYRLLDNRVQNNCRKYKTGEKVNS